MRKTFCVLELYTVHIKCKIDNFKDYHIIMQVSTTWSFKSLLLRFLQMHVIYIILSLHAKNQPPTTILSYV